MTSLEKINFNVDPQMLLEIVERDMGMLGLAEPQKLYQSYKGQLKLSVYVNHGLLTIHVQEGLHITARDHSTCNTYVKLTMLPDNSKRTTCKTRTIKETDSNPIYDEKFSFELLEKDLTKRLLVSVYSVDKRKGKECLGCMSFGVNNIKTGQKTVSDWYYLLAPEMGRFKHLQVLPGRATYDDISLASSQQVAPSVAPEPHPNRMDTFNLCLQRRSSATVVPGGVVSDSAPGSGGYGFSVIGGGPVQVSRVDPGSPAAVAGLRLHDRIIRIDGQNVKGANANAVGRIIKHTQQHVVLEIQRPREAGPTPIVPLHQSPRLPRRHSLMAQSVAQAPLPAAPMHRASLFPAAGMTSHYRYVALSLSQFQYQHADAAYYDDEAPPTASKRLRLSHSILDINNTISERR